MTSNFLGSGLTSFLLMTCPSYVTSIFKNQHLLSYVTSGA